MRLYLVRMFDEASGEVFLNVGVTQYGVKERFAYGSTKVADSDLPLKEELERMAAGEKYISDRPYRVEELHPISYKLDGDARLGEAGPVYSIPACPSL